MRMTRQHYEFLADKFILRGTEAWERNYIAPVIDDEIEF